MKGFKLIIIAFGIFLTGNISPASVNASDDDFAVKSQKTPWSFLFGYGITHNGLGKTQINVETIDLVVGYEKFITDTFGPYFLKGRHSCVIEVPLHLVVDPWESPMIGINFLARWTFKNYRNFKPYVFGGGGPVYTKANIQGLGADLNGNWQFGGGINIVSDNMNAIIIEYRFHHISNMGAKDPNDSLNSSKVLVGMKF